MISKIIKSRFLDIFFIFLLSLTPLLWFRQDAIMVGHDNVFPLDPIEFLKGRLYTWSDQNLGQDQSIVIGTIPTHLIDALPYFLGFSLQTTQKIVYVFWFFLMGLSPYVLALVINRKSRFFQLAVAIFYQFNFFILQGWFIAERTKFAAYIALPLVLAVFLLVYQKKLGVVRAAIYNSLIFFIFNAGGILGIHLFGGFFISLSVFLIFFTAIGFLEKKPQTIKSLFLTVFLSIFSIFLINCYALLPSLISIISKYRTEMSLSGGLSGFVKWAEEISANSSFVNLFRLQGIAEWADNPDHPYALSFLTNPYLIVLSFLWPTLVFSSLILNEFGKKAKITLYFCLVYLIGIFFTAGNHPPLGFIYSFLINKIPGFAIFRSPYFKFAPALFLANAFLIALFIDRFKRLGKKVLFCLIILLWLLYHYPYFTGNFFAWQKNLSTRVKVPDYVFETAQWLNQEKKEEGRILLLPPNSRAWYFDVYRWQYLSLFPILRLTTQESILTNDSNLTDNQQSLLNLVYQSLLEKNQAIFQRTTSLLGIKYLLLRNDVFYDLDWVNSEPPALYQDVLPAFDLIKPQKKFGEWTLYEIAEPRSFFNTVGQLSDLKMSIDDTRNYLDFNFNDFFIREINSKQAKEDLSVFIADSYLRAECLSCRHEKPPTFSLPEKVIFLPDSPFYFLTKIKRELKIKTESPKVALYDYLGLSLKHLAEIRKFIQERKIGQELKKEYLTFYHQDLEKMDELFNQINELEDKYEAAYNLEFYLNNEEDYLRVFLGESIGDEEDLKIFEKTFGLIAQIRKNLKTSLFTENPRNNKLYLVNVDKENNYEIFLRKEGLEDVLTKPGELKIAIDNQYEKTVKINSLAATANWLNFGETKLTTGEHQLILTLPETENLISDFGEDELQMRTQTDRCYLATINDFDNRKTYKIEINYSGGLANDFSMYLASQKNNEIFRRVTKLGKEGSEAKQELIYPDEKIQNQQIGFCGPELSLSLLKEKVSLNVYEIIHPWVILTAKEKTTPPLKIQVSYKKINPTRYEVEIKGAQQPYVLSFFESFDTRWEALIDKKPLKTHFIINGYANGWKIEKNGDYKIIIEYLPQKLFNLGILISLSFFLINILYLLVVSIRPWISKKN